MMLRNSHISMRSMTNPVAILIYGLHRIHGYPASQRITSVIASTKKVRTLCPGTAALLHFVELMSRRATLSAVTLPYKVSLILFSIGLADLAAAKVAILMLI